MSLQHDSPLPSALPVAAPSPWVCRFAPLIAGGGTVLDLACGNGRHALFLEAGGRRVVAADRDAQVLAGLAGHAAIRLLPGDLETGPWPFAGQSFDGIVVANYLFRPRLPLLATALAPGGVLIYETFMRGNERFGRPSNPDYLLRPDELLEVFGGRLAVVAFEQGEVAAPRPAVVQRLCAVRLAEGAPLRLPEFA